jgi:hypothetical protein
MRSTAKNKCVPLLAPALDMRTKISFSTSTIGNKNYLDVKGITLNKGYPSQELYIEDNVGNKVFLFTDGPGGEGDIFSELIEPWYDNIGIINLSIEINLNGDFKDQVIQRYPINDAFSIFNAQARDAFTATGLYTSNSNVYVRLENTGPLVNSLEFGEVPHLINNWNLQNLQKKPADDCNSIPCCGQFNCCGDENE